MNQINPASTTTNAIPVMIRIAMNRPSMGPANVDALSGSHQCMTGPPPLVRGEGEILSLGRAGSDAHRRGLGAVLLVPRFDAIRARGRTLDAEAAAVAAPRVARLRQHA